MRILAAVLCLLSAVPAYAEDCTTFDMLVRSAPTGMVKGISEPIIGPKGLALIAQWNAMDPPTHIVGDAMQFAFFTTGQIGIAILAKGCVVDRSVLPPELFEKLMKPLKGNDA